MNRLEFGEILTSKRNEMGFSLVKMAKKTGLSPSMLNQMEHGGIIKPSYDSLLKICKAYDIDENEAKPVFFEETSSLSPGDLLDFVNFIETELDFSMPSEKKKELLNRYIKRGGCGTQR